MTSNQLLAPYLIILPILAFFAVFCILIQFLRSASFKGWMGECMTRTGLSKLDPLHYQQFGDLYLPRPDGAGSTQLDHVVVSPFGIFVIETKNYQGWIFGSEKQKQWTQQIYHTKHRFQNPLHQNHLHVRALMDYLGLPKTAFHSVVFFIGGAELKTPMPPNVLTGGLLTWIKNHQTPIIDSATVAKIQDSLSVLERSTNRRTASRAHIKHLQGRTPTGTASVPPEFPQPPPLPQSRCLIDSPPHSGQNFQL